MENNSEFDICANIYWGNYPKSELRTTLQVQLSYLASYNLLKSKTAELSDKSTRAVIRWVLSEATRIE